MEITLAELEARIRACRDQEQILIWLLGGQSALIITPAEIPARIAALADTYHDIISAFHGLASSPKSDRGINGGGTDQPGGCPARSD